jgi:hypothetical protein
MVAVEGTEAGCDEHPWSDDLAGDGRSQRERGT